ncbi:hypothetical protein A3H74_04090 [Candidatus Kaiserbacteria bacterium RIFCSPLOWO2_02_FULL_51_13]|uniref:DUF192 domain-containing protein n=1 Tax=Candidatus Kaiserbacteria bacterium RIFCSPLOWO2_01_FULL_50_24 TaxID=1798507 RepID=A0A1F6ENC8_9BACT|nr:MAG: hypothetical protein A3A34_02220 [Candidatus Kaiserbacteria bacterium RIFCSPLOWO2_01_FULL_50_24]OGG81073.1 MAG: hypothetical protein A3H74_04090 [Candidatus Kaiserbacteria bacterium RIFCSPLOWO2_02_FULL_51_13]
MLKKALVIFTVLGALYATVFISGVTNPFSWFVGEWWRTEVTIEIGGERIKAHVRDTPKARAEGLSGWEALSDGEGMLFVFSEDGHHTFWMKDMNFPIDIVWISESGPAHLPSVCSGKARTRKAQTESKCAGGEVVDIKHNVSPDTYPEYSFAPQVPARYVLELPAGWMVEHGVVVGDDVEL